METVVSRVFLFTTNLQLKLRKKNLKILSFFAKKLPKRLIPTWTKWNIIYRAIFYYPDDLETSEAGISESQEAIHDFINKQKSENTKGRRLLI